MALEFEFEVVGEGGVFVCVVVAGDEEGDVGGREVEDVFVGGFGDDEAGGEGMGGGGEEEPLGAQVVRWMMVVFWRGVASICAGELLRWKLGMGMPFSSPRRRAWGWWL